MFLFIMLAVFVVVMAKGGPEERFSLSVLFSGFFLTSLFYHQGSENWLEPQWSIIAVDTLAFLIFAGHAMWSKRFWPLAIAALQLLPVLTPLVALFGKNTLSYGLGVTQGIWGYFQMAILVIAAKRYGDRVFAK